MRMQARKSELAGLPLGKSWLKVHKVHTRISAEYPQVIANVTRKKRTDAIAGLGNLYYWWWAVLGAELFLSRFFLLFHRFGRCAIAHS